MSPTGPRSSLSAIATSSARSCTSPGASRTAMVRSRSSGRKRPACSTRWTRPEPGGCCRFAVASSIGVYTGLGRNPLAGGTGAAHRRLIPHLIVAFKKAVEPLTTHALQGSGVQPVDPPDRQHLGTSHGSGVPVQSRSRPTSARSCGVRRRRYRVCRLRRRLVLRARRRTGNRPADVARTNAPARHLQRVQRSARASHGEFTMRLLAITPGPQLARSRAAGHGPGASPYLDITRLVHDTGFAPGLRPDHGRSPTMSLWRTPTDDYPR